MVGANVGGSRAGTDAWLTHVAIQEENAGMEAWPASTPRIRVGYCALVICTVIVWLWLTVPAVAVTVRVELPTAVPGFPPP
jgi:hypothetical protein